MGTHWSKGKFAIVKRARHLLTGEDVAIKVIDKDKIDEISRLHIHKEVRSALYRTVTLIRPWLSDLRNRTCLDTHLTCFLGQKEVRHKLRLKSTSSFDTNCVLALYT